MGLTRQLAAAATFVLPAAAGATWTVTSYVVASVTTSVWTEYAETYTDTYTYGLQKTYKPPKDAATLTSTYSDPYEELDIVEIYVDPAKIDEEQIVTSTSYDYDDYSSPYTYYVQNVVYTAPTSCPTPFTVTTQTTLNIPTEVLDGVSFESVSTSIYTYGSGERDTYINAVVPASLVPTTTTDAESDYIYSYYIADCRNPTATDNSYYGYWDSSDSSDSDDDSSDSSGSSSGDNWNYDLWDYQPLRVYVIIIASVIPGIFLLGFLENYFWFRRMMTGKFSLRFGTCCWIFLILPVMCFTRQCPARDAETQKTLKEQWKQTGFGKALGLWFRHGFRHRYPVDLLGAHPLYNNPPAAMQPPMGQPFPGNGGPPPPGGYIYYAPGPMPDGSMPPPPHQGEFKGMPPPPHGMPAPPPGMVMYYPQYPQQAYVQPQAAPAPGVSPSPPSPVSDATQQAQYAPSPVTAPSQDASAPQMAPQPHQPHQELQGQPGPSAPPATHQHQ